MRQPPLLASLALAAVLGCATAPEGPRPAGPAPDPGALGGRCARGFPADCRTLGRAYLLGEGVPRDDRLAAGLLIQSCELGDPAGCADLGVLYAIGRALPQSDERAVALSRRACEQGSALACSNQGALLAEGVAPLPDEDRSAPADEGRILRLFRTSCDAGVPEGCLDLGTALEQGKLGPRELGQAGKAYRRSCEAGLALAVREHPEVAPDLTQSALEARACAQAVAPACLAVDQKAPPPGSRTPSTRLVDGRGSYALGIPGAGGFHPGDLSPASTGHKRSPEEARRPTPSLQAQVPPPLRARLGVEVASGESQAADPAVEGLVALRRLQLGACYEAPRAIDGKAEVLALFLVDADGRPADVRSASVPEDAPLEACVRDVVGEWEFPVAADGYSGPHLVRFTFEPAPAGPPPAPAGSGALRPSLRDPSCVERHLAVPPDYRGAVGAATVRLAVDGSGTPGLVHALTPMPEPVLAAITSAIGRCEWAPGADASGRPGPQWTTLTVKVAGK